MGKILRKLISIALIAAFSFNTCCYGLATLPASQNPAAKCEILASLARRIVRYAESPEAIKLLKDNNAECLLLSSGRYLVTEEVSKDDLRLLRAINHEDIEAMMQILKRENPHSYQIIKDAFLESFPYDKKSNLSEELYVNHTIAKALEWLLLAKEGIISENKIPESKKDFVKKAEKVIVSINYIFIEEGFWDLKKRGDRIQKARNKGMRFYQVATSLSEEQEKRGSLLKERIFGKDDFVSLNGFIKTFIQSTGLPGNEKIIVRFPSEMRDRGTNDFTIELPDGLSEAYKGILSEYIAARVLNAMLNNGGTKSVIRCPEGWTNIIKRSLTRDKLYAKVKDRLETYYGKSSFEIQYNPTDAEALTKKQLQLIQEQQNPSISYQDTEGVYLGIDIGGSSIKLAAIVGGKEHMLGRINEKIYEKKDAQEYIELIKKSIATAHERLRNAMGVIRIDGIGVSWNAAIKNDTIVYGESMINRLGESEAKKVSRLPKDIKNWARQIYGPEVRVAIRNDGHMGAFQAAYSERRRDTAYLGLGFSIALGYISREGRNAPGLCELHFSRIDLSDTGHGVEYDIPGALGYYLGVRGVVKEGKKLNVVGDDVLDTSFEKAKHIVSQANAGDETKLSIAKTMGRYLAEEALSLYNHWPVEHVIVGGGLLTGKFGETMIEEAESILKREFPEVKVSLSLYNGNRLYVSAVGAARYASSMKREADILHTIEWLIQRVKTRCNVVFDSDIKKELVFEFGGEFAPSLITRSYTTRKGIADQKEYLKNLVYQEAILLYTATQSRGQNIPIRVSIDRSKLELMKEARDMLSDNIKDIIEESKGFWEEEIKKYSGDVHSFNEHSPERPPKISVNIASTSARFSSLLKRIKELKAGMQKDDFELVVVLADPYEFSEAKTEELYRNLKSAGFPSKVILSGKNTIAINRNLGICHSQGDFIIFLDDDVKLIGPVIEKLVKVLEDRPELGLVSVPSYDWRKMIHRPGSYHLKYRVNDELILTNRVSGMVMATRTELAKIAPFPTIWPNFAEDAQFSMQINRLGYLNAFVCPADTYAIHENRGDKLTANIHTLANVLINEGMSCYLEPLAASEELCRNLTITRMKQYGGTPASLSSIEKFWKDYRIGIENFLNGDSESLDELLQNACKNDWANARYKSIEEAAEYFRENKRQIVAFKNGMYKRLKFSDLNPFAGPFSYQKIDISKNISAIGRNMIKTAKIQKVLKKAVGNLKRVIKAINKNAEVVEIKIMPSSFPRGLMIDDSDFDNLVVYIRGIQQDQLQELNSLFLKWLQTPGLRLIDDYENPPLLIRVEDKANQELAYGINEMPMVTVYDKGRFSPRSKVAEEVNGLASMLFEKNVARIKIALSRGELDEKWVRSLLKNDNPESYYHQELMGILNNIEGFRLPPYVLNVVSTLDELYLKDKWTYVVPQGEEKVFEQALIELYEKGLVRFIDGKLMILWRMMGARWTDSVWNRRRFEIYSVDSHNNNAEINMLGPIEKKIVSQMSLIPEIELLESMASPNPYIAERAIRQSIGSRIASAEMIQAYLYNLGRKDILVNAAVIEAIKADKDCCEQELKEKLKEEISSKGQLSYFSPVRKRTLLIINILFNLALARPEKTDELVEFIFKTVISQKDIPDRIIQDVLKSLGTAYGNISNPELREMVYGFFSESAQSHIVRRKRIAQDMLKKADQIRSGYVLESEDSYGNMILEATSGEKISYKNYFTKGVFEPRNTILASAVKGREVTVIVDEAIYEEYHDKIRKYLETHHISGYSIYCGKASEHNKNIDSVFEIIDSAMKDGRNRKAIFVVVGGGTLMDVVGLVAQLYRRKVDYIRVPTTLLGIIDAGIGVKVGVNYKGHKNFVGAFYPPYAVVSDVSFLRTLDPRQMRSGMAEMLKMAIVSDRRLFEDIEKYGDKIIRNIPFEEKDEIIRRASMGELRHIQRDFYERDLRREVDFGHTFAHYIEDISEYSLLHGEAVALDVLITSHIAMQRGILKPAVFERIVKVVQGLGLPLFHESLTLENMVTGVQRAKEHKGGRLIAVIPEDIGKVVFTEEISKDEIEEALKYFRMKSGESSEPYGHPAFAFENMPEGIFTLKQYGEKTGVPLSTARRDFNVLEELGLVTIHKGSGNRPNEIESKFQEGIDKAEILNILSQYKDVRDIAKISYLIQETLNKGMRFFDVKQDKTNFPLFVYLGGGGPGATRITKEGSLQSAEGEKGSLGIGSIVTTFDYGGHSRKIQDFVREKEGKYIPSPGDTAALLSWLTPETWQPGPNSKESLQNVIDKEAKLNFLFKERITGENVIDTFRDRFATIDRDVDIKKSADWENFKEEMYGIARILDEYLAEMKIKNASVQNLMLLGCMVKMNFNISLALPEAQRILGIKGAKIIPVSSQESQLVGRFRNGREVFSEDAIAERDHGERFELFAFRKEKSNKNDAEQEAEDWPVARSEALDAIQKAKSAILTGASSIFTSVLPNFLVKDIALAVSERVNEGLPSILFANTAYEFESLHLTPVQIFETFERSIENVPGNNGIKLEDLYTHVVLPRIPESVKQEFLAGAREAIFKYLNQEGNRKLQAVAYDINDLDSIRMALEKMRKIFMNKNYQTDETIKGISDGKIKPGKIVPFHFYDYSQEVEEYLRRKGINVIWLDGPEDYFIWEGNVVHNTNSVIKVTKRICHETSTIEATSGALMLDLDNTFLRTEEGLEESLDERPTLKKLVSEILRRGVKVGFFSGVQYEQTENEPGIERRIIDHIPLKLRRGITVYSNSGAEEITFNVEGASSSNSEYNERTKISPHERKVLEGILEEAKNRYLRRVGRDRRRYHDIYGAEFFDKEPYSQFKGGKSDGSVYQIELVWIPSRKAIKNAEPGSEAETILHYGQKDEREVVVSFIQARIDQEKQKGALPTNTDYFVISGGFATIDISKTNKAAAVKHYVRSNSLNMDEVIYFGDSFGIGGNDRPVKSINNLLAVNVGEEIDIPGLVNLGEGVISTEKCLAQIAEILESLAKKKNFKSAVGIFKKQITENSYDAEHAAVLLFDLLHSSLQENRTYEIKYDISRLSSSQIELVETYIDRLRKMSGHSCTINSVGFSSKRTKKKRPLIEVSCMGENFAGKGRVDIKGNTEGYLLRLVGMMNMAFATSNIPSNATDEEMNTKYGPILGFIQRQYKDIFGAELVLPKSAEDILKVIQYISRTLPRAYKMPTDKIDEYNRLAIKALISA